MATEIVYLLGAGASYGTREKDGNGKDIPGKIIRGVPIVNEMEDAVKHLITEVENKPNVQEKARSRVLNLLNWLAEKCQEFPTIDTCAELLYVTEQNEEYEKLKNALSLFFTLIQDKERRDLRYDGFIASLIDESLKFPNKIKILSWNYDSQFEFAFSKYLREKNQYMMKIRGELNVSGKTTQNSINNNFGIIKLNGTAFAVNTNDNDRLMDMFYRPDRVEKIWLADGFFITQEDNFKNILSFAWDNENKTESFFQSIEECVNQVKILVIIGYSFPDVNRKIDSRLIQRMTNLEKIYIQDCEPDVIYERFLAALSEQQKILSKDRLQYIPIRNLDQFVIPSKL